MIDPARALSSIPERLRLPLLKEYGSLTQAYAEGRWDVASLKAGRFCEVAYSILKGHADGSFPDAPAKPDNMVAACKALENKTALPRGLRILAARLIPAIYEVRNNRDVGHIGGDVASNRIDATLAISAVDWLLSEMIRVFHAMEISDAQAVIDALSQRRSPVIWEGGNIKRILDPSMQARDQALVLLDQSATWENVEELRKWCDYKNSANFRKIVQRLHDSKQVEYDAPRSRVRILPPGSNRASDLVTDFLRRQQA